MRSLVLLTMTVAALPADAAELAYNQLQAGPVLLTASGDARFRFEYRKDFSFDKEATGQRSWDFLRSRLGVEARWESLTAFVQALDSRELVTPPDRRTQVNPFDLHQGFVQWKHLLGSPLTLKAGRQELAYGSKLVVFCPAWANHVRSWDSVKVAADGPGWRLDAVAGRVVPPKADGFDTWKTGENFWMVWLTRSLVADLSFDAYVVTVHDQARADPKPVTGEDGAIGPLTRVTPGARLFGSVLDGRLDLEAEVALQAGSKANDALRGAAVHLSVGGKLPLPASPRLRADYNRASGDTVLGDGSSETFFVPYGTLHDPFGLIDFFRWQNMEEAALFASATPLPGLGVQAEYHAFWLATSSDDWVSSGGKVLRKARPGTSRWVGHELSLVASWTLYDHFKVEPGMSFFLPGTFVEQTGKSDPASLYYLQLVAML